MDRIRRSNASIYSTEIDVAEIDVTHGIADVARLIISQGFAQLNDGWRDWRFVRAVECADDKEICDDLRQAQSHIYHILTEPRQMRQEELFKGHAVWGRLDKLA